MLRSWLFVRLLCLLWLSANSAAAEPLASPATEADGYVQVLDRIAPGVWVFHQPRFQVQPAGNVTLIEQSDGLVLIDTGGSPGAARRIVAKIQSMTDKPVKAVVVTHWHGDHPLGLSEILRAWPQARTIATRATQAHLRDPKTMNTPAEFDAAVDAAFQARIRGFAGYSLRMADEAKTPEEQSGWSGARRLFDHYARDMAGAVTRSTHEAFRDSLVLADTKTPIELRFLGRANTDGDAVAWLPRQKVLVAGDIVVAPFPFGFGSYPADWIGVLDQLGSYEFEVLVPGHGPPQTGAEYLVRLRRALRDVRAQVAPLAADGLSLEEVRVRANFTAQIADFAGQDPWLRRWVEEYWIKPITAAAYKEARGEPTVQSLESE